MEEDDGLSLLPTLKSKSHSEGCKPTKLEKRSKSRKSTGSQASPDRDDVETATDFLASIETGSPKVVARSPSTQLHIVPVRLSKALNKFCLNEEEEELNDKAVAWVCSSGKVKCSYRHLLHPRTKRPPFVDLPSSTCILSGSHTARLNKEFATHYPHLDATLSLSEILNLRYDLVLHLCSSLDVEPSTVAIAWRAFNLLLDKNVVTKQNLYVYGGVCCLLAYKFSEDVQSNAGKAKLAAVTRYLKELRPSGQRLIEAEFSVYSYIDFSLHLSFVEIEENYTVITKQLA